MTATTLYVLHCIAFALGLTLLAAMLAFIAAVCIMVWLCSIFRAESNGYAKRFRLPKDRTPRRTLKITPEREDPEIVGDVSQAQWPQGRFPASRANVRRGEG